MKDFTEYVWRHIFQYLDDPVSISVVAAYPLSNSWKLSIDSSLWKVWFQNVWWDFWTDDQEVIISKIKKSGRVEEWKSSYELKLHTLGPYWNDFSQIRSIYKTILHLGRAHFPNWEACKISFSSDNLPEDFANIPKDLQIAYLMGVLIWSWKSCGNIEAYYYNSRMYSSDEYEPKWRINRVLYRGNPEPYDIRLLLKQKFLSTVFCPLVISQNDKQYHYSDTYLDYLVMQEKLMRSAIIASELNPELFFGFIFESGCHCTIASFCQLLFGYRCLPKYSTLIILLKPLSQTFTSISINKTTIVIDDDGNTFTKDKLEGLNANGQNVSLFEFDLNHDKFSDKTILIGSVIDARIFLEDIEIKDSAFPPEKPIKYKLLRSPPIKFHPIKEHTDSYYVKL